MNNPTAWGLFAATALICASCGGGSGVEELPTPGPTATPVPTATPEPTPTPTPVPALPSFNAPAPVGVPGVVATPLGASPLGKVRNPPPSGGMPADGSPAAMPETCAGLPSDRLSPADILRCSDEALLEALSFTFMTHVQMVPSGGSSGGSTLEVRGAYDSDESKVEYVAIFSIDGQAAERIDYKQIGDAVYRRLEQGGMESPWESGVVEVEAVLAVNDMRLRSALAMTATRSGMEAPGSPDCGPELARLLDPDQSGGEDYHVVEVFPSSRGADGCESYLVETHWVSRETLRPWRTVIEIRGPAAPAAWSGQMVFLDYDTEQEIEPPPGLDTEGGG